MIKYDLIVIGAGILGLSHAFHAARKNLKVLIVEKNSQAMGSSIQNFGQIVPSGFGIRWQQWGRQSLSWYQKIHEEQDIRMNPLGSVYIASDEEEVQLLEELSEINKTQEYPSHLLTKNECLSMYKGLNPGYVKAGLYFPDEISLDSGHAIPAISAYLRDKLQMDIQFNTCITDVSVEQDHVKLNVAGGATLYCAKLLLCNGYEYSLLFPDFFAGHDLQVVKLQMMQLSDPGYKIQGNILSGYSIRRYESFKECASYKSLRPKVTQDHFAAKYGIHLLIKQNQDGSLIIGDSHEYADLSDRELLRFHETNPLINEFILQEAQEMFDLQSSRVLKTWVGQYSQLKSGDLIQATIADQIYIAAAIGGKGMTASLGWAEWNIDHIFN